MLENWLSYDLTETDGNVVTKVDLSWYDMRLQWSQRPYLLHIAVVPKSGFGFNIFQKRRIDSYLKTITEKADDYSYICVGERRSNSKVELFLYGRHESRAHDFLQKIKKGSIQMQSEVRLEPDWATYCEKIYPDPMQSQSCDDRMMIERLKKCGDDLKTARRINHHVVFPNELFRIDFEQDALQAGFAIGEPYYSPERPLAYGSCVHNRSTLDYPQINDSTTRLIKIASKHNGKYEYWDCPLQRRRR